MCIFSDRVSSPMLLSTITFLCSSLAASHHHFSIPPAPPPVPLPLPQHTYHVPFIPLRKHSTHTITLSSLRSSRVLSSLPNSFSSLRYLNFFSFPFSWWLSFLASGGKVQARAALYDSPVDCLRVSGPSVIT